MDYLKQSESFMDYRDQRESFMDYRDQRESFMDYRAPREFSWITGTKESPSWITRTMQRESLMDYRDQRESFVDYRDQRESFVDYRDQRESFMDYRDQRESFMDYRDQRESFMDYRDQRESFMDYRDQRESFMDYRDQENPSWITRICRYNPSWIKETKENPSWVTVTKGNRREKHQGSYCISRVVGLCWHTQRTLATTWVPPLPLPQTIADPQKRTRSHSFKIFQEEITKQCRRSQDGGIWNFHIQNRSRLFRLHCRILPTSKWSNNSFIHGFPCYNTVQKLVEKVLKIPGAHVAGNSEHRAAFFPAPHPQECLCLSIAPLSLSFFLSLCLFSLSCWLALYLYIL